MKEAALRMLYQLLFDTLALRCVSNMRLLSETEYKGDRNLTDENALKHLERKLTKRLRQCTATLKICVVILFKKT
jgi:hypothetical protein